jgi:hypothetical protein
LLAIDSSIDYRSSLLARLKAMAEGCGFGFPFKGCFIILPVDGFCHLIAIKASSD